MEKFKKIVYAEELEKTEELYENFLNDYSNKYPNLVTYVQNLYEIRERWCMSYRKNLRLRGSNTNNYVEAQFLVLKDNILNRTKEVCLCIYEILCLQKYFGFVPKFSLDMINFHGDQILWVSLSYPNPRKPRNLISAKIYPIKVLCY